jgi:hypothetical protein
MKNLIKKSCVLAYAMGLMFTSGLSHAGGYPVYDALVHQALTNPMLPAGLYDAIGKLSRAQEATQKAMTKAAETREEASYQRDVARESVRKTMEDARNTRPTVNGCMERTSGQLGAGVGMAGGSRSGAGVAGSVQRTRDNASSPIDTWGSKLGAHNEDPDLCTTLDGRRNAQRKTQCGGDGIKANADVKAGSIFAAAGTGETVVRDVNGAARDPNRETANFSMDAKDQLIANKAVANIITGDKPPLLPPDVEGTPAGRGYLAMTKVHDARMSTALGALADIAERRAQPKTLSATAQEAWNAKQETFKQLFANRPFPAKPSVFEFMNLRANEPSTKLYQDALKQAGGEELQREMVRRVDVNTQVAWMNFQQLERLTAINAAILAHGMEPVTQEAMRSSREAAMRGNN